VSRGTQYQTYVVIIVKLQAAGTINDRRALIINRKKKKGKGTITDVRKEYHIAIVKSTTWDKTAPALRMHLSSGEGESIRIEIAKEYAWGEAVVIRPRGLGTV